MKSVSGDWEAVAVGFIFGFTLAAPLFYWAGTVAL
jgi:apolipoprotein N-acyltransferase